MVMAALPIFDLGLLLLIEQEHQHLFLLAKLHHMVYLYLIILVYSYILFGFLLAIASGLASMYLRHQLVYDVLHQHRRVYKHAMKFKKPDQPHKIHISHR